MLEQELKNIWKNSSKSAQISIETDRLVKEFGTKMTDIQKKIRKRDVREISASVFGILIFSFFAYEIPFPITKFSCFLSILWFVYVIYKFRKSNQQNTSENLSLPLKEQLAHKKQLMQQQQKLLDSAGYWYAGPSFITNLIFIIGLRNPADYNWTNQIAESLLPLTVNAKAGMIIGLGIFYLLVIWVHKIAAKREVQPILKNIEVIQQQLNNSN
ncbi:MAG: cbb3-type cytochrome oxidase subunit 3 [Polaribacter sp.]|jgi:cbb3-type cytochrome oxidase subunit 3